MPYHLRTLAEKEELVAAWRRSGVSKTRFAREQGLPASAFSRWIARIEGHDDRTSFLPVHVAPEPQATAPSLVVELAGSGHRVEVPAGFHAGELRRLVLALC